MVLCIRLCHPSTTILTSFGADLAKENNEQHTGCKLSFADMLYLSIWLIRLLATKYIKSNHFQFLLLSIFYLTRGCVYVRKICLWNAIILKICVRWLLMKSFGFYGSWVYMFWFQLLKYYNMLEVNSKLL